MFVIQVSDETVDKEVTLKHKSQSSVTYDIDEEAHMLLSSIVAPVSSGERIAEASATATMPQHSVAIKISDKSTTTRRFAKPEFKQPTPQIRPAEQSLPPSSSATSELQPTEIQTIKQSRLNQSKRKLETSPQKTVKSVAEARNKIAASASARIEYMRHRIL